MKMLQNFLASSPFQYLGGSISNGIFSNTQFLQPGSYQVSGMPGGDLGSFTATAKMPAPITWTNRDQIAAVNRSQPLNITWSSGSGTQVVIVGFGVDLPNDSTTVFGCLTPPGATSFPIPTSVLANVPATRGNPLQSKDVIYLGNVPDTSSAANLMAAGLDAGAVAFQYATGKTVIFQ